MDVSLNIVELIENNPITRLSGTYQNKLLTKIKTNFIDNEQQMFVSSFYCYLNYNKTDFIIDLDTIWVWLGFSQKIRAKELLEKQIKEIEKEVERIEEKFINNEIQKDLFDQHIDKSKEE